MITLRYRPQARMQIRGQPLDKWQPRRRLTLFPGVYNIGSHLHYLACHAPLPVRSRWKSAYRRFCDHYRDF